MIRPQRQIQSVSANAQRAKRAGAALWRDRNRRRTLPLLLALLLLILQPLQFDAACFDHSSHSHHEDAPVAASHHDQDADSPHHSHQTAHEHAASVDEVIAAQQDAPQDSQTCCTPQTPLEGVMTFVAPPSARDNSSVVFAASVAVPAAEFQLDALVANFGRAGPPIERAPAALFLSSHTGRSPPVSL